MKNEENTKLTRKSGAADIAYTAVSAAMIAICAWITVPGPVPFTLQTFAVFFSVLTLGGRRATTAVAAYILLGAVGLPVFSGFKGGLGSLFGVTGGYIAGFLLSAAFMWLTEKYQKNAALKAAFSAAALIICYTFGTVWFLKVYTQNTGPISLVSVLLTCVLPFVPFDAAKIALAVFLSSKLKRFIK